MATPEIEKALEIKGRLERELYAVAELRSALRNVRIAEIPESVPPLHEVQISLASDAAVSRMVQIISDEDLRNVQVLQVHDTVPAQI